MPDQDLCVVTGAFGFSGRHITRRLIQADKRVITLSNHPQRPNEFGDALSVRPYNFDKPDELAESIRGASVLFNTYWIRFEKGDMTFAKAVQNSKNLIKAAELAGIRRIVHFSVANPSIDSPLPYHKGKAEVEQAIHDSSLSYAILRPAAIFGDQGILINNIAWFMRHLPVFGVPGNGEYKLQPIFVEDVASLAVDSAQKDENITLDAVGPEIYTFNDLLKLIEITVHSRTMILHLPPQLALIATSIMGYFLHDVILTNDEVKGLLDNLLVSNHPPTGKTLLSEWLRSNSDWIGIQYMSEVKKHYG